MQFLILAHDAKDPDALNRRMAVREAHLALIECYKAKGHMHMGAALLDDEGKMMGSTLIVEFSDRAGLDAWLAEEPFVTHKIWADIQITPCKIAPPYLKKS